MGVYIHTSLEGWWVLMVMFIPKMGVGFETASTVLFHYIMALICQTSKIPKQILSRLWGLVPRDLTPIEHVKGSGDP